MNTDRFVLLDRDGVINEDSDQFIKSPDEWWPIPGSLAAIALLNRNGYKTVVITNQSGLARGLLTETILNQIHDKMCRLVNQNGGHIEAVYHCPHGPESHCSCRKPKPGLLEAFARDFDVQLKNTFLIGDSLRDIQAAVAAGAIPILVKTGKGEKTLQQNPDLGILVFENLQAAAEYITANRTKTDF